MLNFSCFEQNDIISLNKELSRYISDLLARMVNETALDLHSSCDYVLSFFITKIICDFYKAIGTSGCLPKDIISWQDGFLREIKEDIHAIESYV